MPPPDFDDASEFLGFLHEVYTDEKIFRGQADSRWPLTPKAWRRSGWPARLHEDLGFADGVQQHRVPPVWERRAVAEFCRAIVAQGDVVPGISQDQLDYVVTELEGDKVKLQEGGGWSDHWIRPLVALAQHHGVPTRFLDWSTSPYIAAYFAASGAAADPSIGSLAVFVLTSKDERLRDLPLEGVEVIRVVPAGQKNMAMQKGIFTCETLRAWKGNPPIGAPPLDMAAWSTVATTKLTLVQPAARHLLEILDREYSLSANTLYPGLHGAAMRANEALSWKRNWRVER